MLVLGSGCKYRLSLAEVCTETILNQLLADSYQNPISAWQVTIKLHLMADYKAIPLPSVCGKIVFHETTPWCQKGWGPLLYTKRLHVHFLVRAHN